MIIGIPKEIKEGESRVGLAPRGVEILVRERHEVLIEKGAAEGSNFPDSDYQKVGAKIVSQKEVWASQLVVKVKEPQESEFIFLRDGLILFTYLHLAALPKLTGILQAKNVTAIDYATVELEDGSLPLLKPMSEIAGKLSFFLGAHYLEKNRGGKGILVSEGNVLILGGGTVGSNAAKMALGTDAKVTMFELKKEKCQILNEKFKNFNGKFQCLPFEEDKLKSSIKETDLLIGAVLIPGAKTPKIITEEMVKTMEPGSVIVDVSIDQGGCIETSFPTSHKEPIFIKHGVIHYCVPNMPGVVPRTSTIALAKATLPYVLEIANKGLQRAIREISALAKGVNVCQGKITNQKLAEALGKEYTDILKII